jgi:hypothetical protein
MSPTLELLVPRKHRRNWSLHMGDVLAHESLESEYQFVFDLRWEDMSY